MFRPLLLCLVLIAAVSAGGYNSSPSRRPVVFRAPRPIRRHQACCTAFDDVLANLDDKVDDTEDDSKDLEDKVHRLSRMYYRLKKTQFNEWANFKRTTEKLASEPQGAPGPDGSNGSTGTDGAPGPQGPAGPKGEDGPAGDDIIGINGADGTDGENGARGPTGPDGEVGEVFGNTPGAPGPLGYQGPVGPSGLRGEVGPQGEQGPDGPQGPEGLIGAAVDCEACLIEKCEEKRCYSRRHEPNIGQCARLGCYLLPGRPIKSEMCVRFPEADGCGCRVPRLVINDLKNSNISDLYRFLKVKDLSGSVIWNSEDDLGETKPPMVEVGAELVIDCDGGIACIKEEEEGNCKPTLQNGVTCQADGTYRYSNGNSVTAFRCMEKI